MLLTGTSDPSLDIGFAEYLQAKFPLDERSLNPQVRALLVHSLQGRPEIRGLDLGTGTGAMLRRLIEWELTDSLVLTGLDLQPELLDQVGTILENLLGDRGFSVLREPPAWRAERAGQLVVLHLHASKLADFQAAPSGFDLITAQAFMDIVPLEDTLRQVKGWLKPGGLFYATLNYDGGTHLFPSFRDEAFEARLLENYDQSMERRRVDGKPTGGSRSGARLHASLLACGFVLLGYGSSDWNMTPERGGYRDQDTICLQAILECIRKEGAENGGFGDLELNHWFLDRLGAIHSGHLGLIAHQLDFLAVCG